MRGPVIVGKVVSTVDPEGLGRVQVQLLAYDATVQVWLRMLMPYASMAAGFVFLPEVDDEVLVLRGADDVIDGMFVLGALYNGAHVPVYTNADKQNITKTIQTRSGNYLTFTDKDSETAIELKTAQANIVTMADKAGTMGFSIANGDGTVTLTMDTNGVKLTVANAKGVTVTSDGDVKVSSTTGNVNVESALEVSVQAGTNLTCKGSVNATLEAGAQLAVKGGAQVSVEAPLVKLAGSLVQIN